MATLYARQLHADLDTPVSAYLKLANRNPWSFLFESVEGDEVWAAYSILGFGARRVYRYQNGALHIEGERPGRIDDPDPLRALRRAREQEPGARPPPGAPRFVGGMFGMLAYDAVRAFEPLGAGPTPHAAEVPDALFFEPETIAVFDNRAHSLTLYSYDPASLDRGEERLRGPLPPSPTPSGTWQEPTSVEPPQQFEQAVERAKQHIRAGDVIQVVLSRRFELPPLAAPINIYRGLRTINPSPYLFFLHTPHVDLAGASPEVMIRVSQGEVIVRPIAGTRPRGATAAEDQALAEEMLADPKERAEHIMLVDLGRNDVGRVSQPGQVSVPSLMVVERYSHVMHIVSEVRGKLAAGLDAFDALRAAFPAGTLSGAPKVRAMQIIDALETSRRGIYGGAVGYFGAQGEADFGIAIRTLAAFPNKLVVQAGAGIVADSNPVKEREETEHKARSVMRAVQWATTEQAQW